MKSIHFESLAENDLPLLHDWFQKPHVRQWYARGENYTIDMIREKYLPRILNPESIPNFIIYANNTPIGYIQLYCVKDSLPDGVTDYKHSLFNDFKPEEIAGIDLFIADENYLKKGYATLTLSCFIKEYVEGKFTLLITDPLKSNKNAIQFFERNGFKKFNLSDNNTANELMILHITPERNEYTEQPLSDQRIIDCINENYGIKIAALTLLPIGADMNASVYKAEANDHSYFIKLKCGRHHDISAAIITLLHDAGIRHIIPPIKTTHGKSIQHIDDFTIIVFPFVEGQDGFSRDLTDDQWVTLGKVMRQIHNIDVPPTIQRMIRHEDYSPKWREAVRSLYVHIESKPGTDEISAKLMTFMKNHAAVIHRLVDRAEQLSKKIQNHSQNFVLCHSDIHGGNVLIDGNDIIYMVDWDDPIMAPKERDLMFIGGGVANVWNKPHEEKFFYKGYGKAEINMAILAYYRHERIVEDIALIGEQILLTSVDNQSKAESYKHFIDQFEPKGVVEIAFKTDEGLI